MDGYVVVVLHARDYFFSFVQHLGEGVADNHGPVALNLDDVSSVVTPALGGERFPGKNDIGKTRLKFFKPRHIAV
jgi:hypothetical protein